jgi:acyl carrier protein
MEPRFLEILARYLPVLGDRPLTGDSALRDLGLDSMHSIDLLFDLEEAFGIAVPDEDLNGTTFETAGSLWAVVSALLPTAPAEPA